MNKYKNKSQGDYSPISQNKNDSPIKQLQRREDQRVELVSKNISEEKKDPNLKDVEKTKALFSLENKISKVKISVPFSKLIKNNEYRKQILKMFKSNQISSDILNLQDDYPTVLSGPRVEERDFEGDSDVPPFYISLNIHEIILHNAMLDSGASHNLMPKAIMESLSLDITKPYS